MREAPWAFSTFWLYTVLVDGERFGIGSRELLRELAAVGGQTRPLRQPLHRSKAHRNSSSYGGRVAEVVNQDALSLPSSVGLCPEGVSKVAELVRASCRTSHTPTCLA